MNQMYEIEENENCLGDEGKRNFSKYLFDGMTYEKATFSSFLPYLCMVLEAF